MAKLKKLNKRDPPHITHKKMMIRAFDNEEQRIATATTLKDGTILQVFPSKKAFSTEELWKAQYPNATFETGPVYDNCEKRRVKAIEKLVTNYLSTPRLQDTEMQRTVRQLYFQLNLRNSVPSTMKEFRGYGSGVRQDSGLYVFLPSKGLITPVYYNYVTGRVFFENTNQEATPTANLVFFHKQNTNLKLVIPYLEPQNPQQKTIIYHTTPYRQIDGIAEDVARLRQAGLNVVYFHSNTTYFDSHTLFILAKQPGFTGLLRNYYDETIFYTPDGKHEKVNFRQWLMKQ